MQYSIFCTWITTCFYYIRFWVGRTAWIRNGSSKTSSVTGGAPISNLRNILIFRRILRSRRNTKSCSWFNCKKKVRNKKHLCMCCILYFMLFLFTKIISFWSTKFISVISLLICNTLSSAQNLKDRANNNYNIYHTIPYHYSLNGRAIKKIGKPNK